MTDVEDILKTTFRDHEHLVDALDPLLPPVRARIAGRRTRRRVLTAVAALVCAGAGGGTAVAIATAGGTHHRPAPVAGWRWESSRGLEFQVPAGWGINDLSCGTPLDDTVLRVVGPQGECALSRPSRVQTASIDAAEPVPGRLRARTVTVGKVRARRAEGQRPDGWYTGWLQVRSPRATLTVVTRDAATTRHILDSARPVTVDRLGCTTHENGETSPAVPAGPAFVPASQVSAVACMYAAGGPDDGLLEASAPIPPSNVAAMVTGLDAAPAVHDHSCPPTTTVDDARVYLRFRDSAGATTVVEAIPDTCTGPVVARGLSWVRLTPEAVMLFLAPLHAGFGLGRD
jgi:hypothetical protein